MKLTKISRKIKRTLLMTGLTMICIIPATTISILSIVSCSSSPDNGGDKNPTNPDVPTGPSGDGPQGPGEGSTNKPGGGPANDHEKPSEPGNGDLKPGDTTTKIDVSLKYDTKLANSIPLEQQQTGVEFKAQRILTNFVNGNVDALNKELNDYNFNFTNFENIDSKQPNSTKWFNNYFVFDQSEVHPDITVTPDIITYPNLFIYSRYAGAAISNLYAPTWQLLTRELWNKISKGQTFPKELIGSNIIPKINVLVGSPDIGKPLHGTSYRKTHPIYYAGTKTPVSIDDMLTANLYFSDISNQIINGLYTFKNPEDANKVYLRLKLVSRCNDKYNTSGINQYIGTNLLINYSLAVKPQYVKNYNIGDETVLANTQYDLLLPLETKTVSVGGGQAEWDRVLNLSKSTSWDDFISKHYNQVCNLTYNQATVNNDFEIVDLTTKTNLIKTPINFNNTYQIVEPSTDYWISMYSVNNKGWYRPEENGTTLSQYEYVNRNQLTPDLFTSTLAENNGPIKPFGPFTKNDNYYTQSGQKRTILDAVQWSNRRVDASQYFINNAAKAREKLFNKYFKVLLTLNKKYNLVNNKYSTIFYSETGGPLTSTVFDKIENPLKLPPRNYFVINNPLFNTGYGYNGAITNQGIYNTDSYNEKYSQSSLTNYPLNPKTSSTINNLMYLSKFLFSNNFPINIFTDKPENYDFSQINTDISYYENVTKFYGYLFFNDSTTPFHKNPRANANQRLYLINWFPEITMDYQLKLSPFVLSNRNPTSQRPDINTEFTYYWNPSFGTFCENWDFKYYNDGVYENFLPTYGTMYSLVFGLGFFADQINIPTNHGKGTYNPKTITDNTIVNTSETSFFEDVIKDYDFKFLYDNYLTFTTEELNALGLNAIDEAKQILEQLLNPAKVPLEAKNWLM